MKSRGATLRAVVAAAIAIPVLALAACAAPNSPASTSTAAATDLSGVTLTVGTAGPRFEASWKFSNPDTPYTVKFAAFDGAAPIVEALNGGGVDLGLAGDLGVISAQASGSDISIVGASSSNPDFLRLIVPKGSSATSLKSLIGKTIAVAKGTSSHAFILKAIAQAGLTPSQFKWAYLSNADAGAAFQRGGVDAWATWDPFAATAELQWGAKLVLHADAKTSGYGYVVTKSKFFVGDSPKARAARDFVARLVQVYQNEIDKRAEWTPALASSLNLSPEVAAQVAKHYYFTSVPLDATVEKSYTSTAELLKEQGIISTIPKASEAFDKKALNTAVKKAIAARDDK